MTKQNKQNSTATSLLFHVMHISLPSQSTVCMYSHFSLALSPVRSTPACREKKLEPISHPSSSHPLSSLDTLNQQGLLLFFFFLSLFLPLSIIGQVSLFFHSGSKTYSELSCLVLSCHIRTESVNQDKTRPAQSASPPRSTESSTLSRPSYSTGWSRPR
jgi:hypothetical protein